MNIILILGLTAAFLCWGSFLNVVGYRVLSDLSLRAPRSHCPHCRTIIAWYDNIPVVSWIVLRGRCRTCHKPISWLYPFIEIITALSFWGLIWFVPAHYWFGYGFFFSALIVSIRTDLEQFLISQWVTLFALPIGLLLSVLGLLPITPGESIVGSITAFAFLYGISFVYTLLTKKIGMGQGDVDLLAFIGAFIGIIGWWLALMIGSCIGSLIGIGIALRVKSLKIKIPFGPFLALGAMSYVLFAKKLLLLLV